MWQFLVRHILRDRVAILIGVGVITVFMAYQAQKVKMSYEMARILPASDSTIIRYDQFKQQFGEDGSILFIGIQDSNIYQLNKFNDWYDLGVNLRKIKGVEEVLSITRLYRLAKNDSLKKFVFFPITPHKPQSQLELDSIKRVILSFPLYKNLIFNEKTGATLMMVTLDKNIINTQSREQFINQIKNEAESFGTKHNIKVHYSGLPFIRTVTSLKVQHELKLFVILALVVAAFFLYLFFRSLKAVIFPILIVVISVIWAIGLMVLFGYKITILTGIIPPLLIVIGVENCIFLLNKYHYEFHHHHNKVKALSRVIERIGKANLLTNAATAAGFAAFIITNNRLLIEFGTIASLNILVVFALSLTLVPIFFSYLPPPHIDDTKHMEKSLAKQVIDKSVHWVLNYRKTIYITTGIALFFGIIGVTRLTTSGSIVDDVPKRDPLYLDLLFFEQNFKGIMPLEITIDTKKKKGVLSYSNLRKINRLEDSLARYPELSKPLSLVDIIKVGRQAFFNGDTSFYGMPTQDELNFMASYIPEIQTKKRNIIRNFLDSNYQITRITVQMANIGTPKIDSIQNTLRPKIDSIFKPSKYTVVMTGTSVVFLKGTNFLIKNLIESILLAVVMIAILLAFLFASWRMILISLIPNLIPQVMTGALMGFLGIPIKPSTILIFSIALGISVDNSIQYLSRYRLQLKHFKEDIPSSVISALKETGYSMIYSSTILFFGFAIFILSSFGSTQALGILVSITLLVAGLLNMFILPSLLLSLDQWSTTRAFKQDYLLEIYDHEEDLEFENLDIEQNEKPD